MEPKTTKHMRWHKEGRHANLNVMVHPSDAKALRHFNIVNFAMNARNVHAVVAIDGFNPFGFEITQYFFWPIFVFL